LVAIASTKDVHDLASLLEIGIAYGTGYLAFNYFKYRERIYSLLNEYLRRYSIDLLPLQSSGTLQNATQRVAKFGPALHFIAECFTDHRLQNRFVSFFYRQPPSFDKIIILYLTFINILLLAFVSLSGIEASALYSFILSAVPASTIILASLLALWFNRLLYKYDRTLDLTYKTYLPYNSNGMPSQYAEQRAAKKAVLISLCVHLMKNWDDAEVKTRMNTLLKEAEDDADMWELLDQHALIQYVRRHLKK
jgi:hypothetical protein